MGRWVGKGKDKKVLCVSEHTYLVFKICGFTCSHKKEHRDIWWNLYTWHTFCVMLVSYDVRHCCQGFFPPSHILTQNMEIINTAKSTDNLSACPRLEPVSHSPCFPFLSTSFPCWVLFFTALGKAATHSSILVWRIPRTEEPGGLYSPWGHKESDMTEAT